MNPLGGLFRVGPQFVIEVHIQPATGGSIEQSATRDDTVEHFLKAEDLSAQLHFIAIIGLGFTAFVFHGKWPVRVGRAQMKLNNIRDTGKTKPE